MLVMHNQILVSLDSLLDTRLACLRAIDEEATYHVLPMYADRKRDVFDEVADGVFHQGMYDSLYKARDVDTLKLAGRTAILTVIQALVSKIANGPWDDSILTINTYPYGLTPEEKEEFADTIEEVVGIEVRMMSMSYQMLTPEILDTYDCFIDYNLMEWLALQGDSICRHKVKTTCYYPALMQGDGVARDTLGNELVGDALVKVKRMDGWDCLEIVYCKYITIKALPVSYFNYLPAQP